MDKKREKINVTQRVFWLGSSHSLLKKWNKSFSETGVTWIWVVGADFGVQLNSEPLSLGHKPVAKSNYKNIELFIHVSLLAGEIEWRVAWGTWILYFHSKRNFHDNEMLDANVFTESHIFALMKCFRSYLCLLLLLPPIVRAQWLVQKSLHQKEMNCLRFIIPSSVSLQQRPSLPLMSFLSQRGPCRQRSENYLLFTLYL